MKSILKIITILLVSLAAASSFAVTPTLVDSAVTTKVYKSNPLDSVHQISHKTTKVVYYFNRTIMDDATETSVIHRWYKEQQLVKEAVIPIKGRNWHCYSTMMIDAGSVGSWRVELLDENKKLINSLEFKVH